MRAQPRSFLAVVVLAAVLALAGGCGGDEDNSKENTEQANTATAPDPEQLARQQSRRRRADAQRQRKAQKNGPPGKKRKEPTAAELRREREREREVDRKFDESFKQTAFDRLLDKLPVRKPPLYVEQYISTEGSHKLHAAVDRKRFLCKLTPAQRKRAVESYYRDADRVMRAGGVKDFTLVVTVTAETTEHLPALATGKNGSISLTSLGRGRSGC